jgi:hypothetical protein
LCLDFEKGPIHPSPLGLSILTAAQHTMTSGCDGGGAGAATSPGGGSDAELGWGGGVVRMRRWSSLVIEGGQRGSGGPVAVRRGGGRGQWGGWRRRWTRRRRATTTSIQIGVRTDGHMAHGGGGYVLAKRMTGREIVWSFQMAGQAAPALSSPLSGPI